MYCCTWYHYCSSTSKVQDASPQGKKMLNSSHDKNEGMHRSVEGGRSARHLCDPESELRKGGSWTSTAEVGQATDGMAKKYRLVTKVVLIERGTNLTYWFEKGTNFKESLRPQTETCYARLRPVPQSYGGGALEREATHSREQPSTVCWILQIHALQVLGVLNMLLSQLLTPA